MKHILVLSLIGILLVGCKEDKCKNKGSGNDDKEVCQELKEPDSEPVAEPVSEVPQEEPEAEPEEVLEANYYGLHAYSAHDSEYQVPLYWCTDGDCDSPLEPEACQGIGTFNDFTIYSETSGTFYGSIPEPISIDTEARQITLTSNTTGNVGKTFEYEYVPELNSWIITYGENCGRVYQFALSP